MGQLIGNKAINCALISQFLPENSKNGFVIDCQSVNAIRLKGLEEFNKDLADFIDPSKYYAVRSASLLEDGGHHSFAGLFDSFLGGMGVEQVSFYIQECIASTNNKRIKEYAKKSGIVFKESYSVFVQEMVFAETSGVLFTRNPDLSHHRDKDVVINASWGLGDTVVSGMVSPDTIYVNSYSFKFEYEIGRKKYMTSVTPNGVIKTPLPEDLSKAKCISPTEIKKLVKISLFLADKFGYNADIEWAMEDGVPYINQIRPITS